MCSTHWSKWNAPNSGDYESVLVQHYLTSANFVFLSHPSSKTRYDHVRMVSSDIKGILHRVLGCIKREEIGEIVQEWGILSQEHTQEVTRLLASSTRAVPRKTVIQKIVDGCVVGI